MFCPKCKNEFHSDFAVCKDCEVTLGGDLSTLEAQLAKDPEESLLLASELDMARLAVAKGILDLANIPFLVRDTFSLALGPFAGGPASFQLYVARKDAERATTELRAGFKELMGSESSYADEK